MLISVLSSSPSAATRWSHNVFVEKHYPAEPGIAFDNFMKLVERLLVPDGVEKVATRACGDAGLAGHDLAAAFQPVKVVACFTSDLIGSLNQFIVITPVKGPAVEEIKGFGLAELHGGIVAGFKNGKELGWIAFVVRVKESAVLLDNTALQWRGWRITRVKNCLTGADKL